ncbi:MAG: MATE family efflux transporter [Marinilabiliales bacterium]|nr:MAG: MATE family efflux transporter [Marinilabiliales bacterium]
MNRQILRLAIPNIITNITVPLLGLVDMALMGHLPNPVFIGAIALGSVVFNLVYTGFGFLRMGTTGFTSQLFGAKNKLGLNLILWRSVLTAAVLGILLIFLQKPIEFVAFSILESGNDVIGLAKEYYQIRIWAAPATLGLYAFYGWFLGMQNAKPPMIIAITINIINIVLDFVFVYWFNYTSAGVAYASLIAQYTGLIMAIGMVLFKYPEYAKVPALRLIAKASELKKFFKVNTDIFFRTIALMLSFTFFTYTSANMGENILAVNSLLIQFFFIFSYFADGFAFAGEALSGKAYGSKSSKLLLKTIKSLFVWGAIAAVFFSFIYLVAYDIILNFLTNNDQLIFIAANFNWWVILLPITTFAAFIWDGVFIGLTASRQMLIAMIISIFGFYFPAYYLSSALLGNHSLWFAMNLFMAARSLFMWYFSVKLLKNIQSK